MIWILVLIGLTSSFCRMFAVNLTPNFYQTQEDDNVTIRWDSQTKTDLSLTNLFCLSLIEPIKVLYHIINSVEYPECQHQQFAGRVQLDRDALRKGRLRLHLSTVTAEDSGDYWCHLAADYDKITRRWGLMATVHFVLNVTQNSHGEISDISPANAAGRGWPDTDREPDKEPESNTTNRRRIGLYCGLVLTVLVVGSLYWKTLVLKQIENQRIESPEDRHL